jgi:methyltransferase (TIGR00027 family)
MREGRPSETALLIARSTVMLSRDPRLSSLVPPGAAEACEKFLEESDSVWRARLRRFLLGSGLVRSAAFFLERFVIPGISLHYAARKRYLEDATRRALAEGLEQVVVLGAGLDTLALRLHRELPGTLFVECDHPATQGVKRRALARWGELDGNLKLVTLDLARAKPPEVLAALPEYRPGADTFLLAEGLTMYLQAEEMDAIFAFLREHAGPRSRFAFTFMEPRADGRVSFPAASPLVGLWLSLVGEPFTWGVRRQDLPRYLGERGFELMDLAGAETLRERYLSPAGLADRRLAVGEYLCLARRLL